MRLLLVACVVLAVFTAGRALHGNDVVAGVHLTLTGDPTEMAVSWVVEGNLSGSVARVVWSAAGGTTHTATNASTIMVTDTEDMSTYSYCGGGLVTHTLFMVLLRELPVGSKISYTASIQLPSRINQVGSAAFQTPPAKLASTLRFLATADVGDPVSHSWTALPQMARQCSEETFGLGLHIGDIAYNLDITPRGDDYLKGVAPMASSFPWMMGPGNHEADCNYTYANYLGRFAAQNLTRSLHGPASGSSRWYSFELGPVHFTMFDTDAYGFDEVAYVLEEQYRFIQADLAAVDRDRTPWIVLMSHRPMYCSPSSYSVAEGAADLENSGARGSHLGWPKQRDDGEPVGPQPAGYGDGFGRLGLLPPIWDPEEAEQASPIPSCGTYSVRTLYSIYGTELHSCFTYRTRVSHFMSKWSRYRRSGTKWHASERWFGEAIFRNRAAHGAVLCRFVSVRTRTQL